MLFNKTSAFQVFIPELLKFLPVQSNHNVLRMKFEGSIYLGYLSLPTLVKLAKLYLPSSKVFLKVKTLDLVLITDELGRVNRFKVGNLAATGELEGEEFQRVFRTDDAGKITDIKIEYVGKCHD